MGKEIPVGKFDNVILRFRGNTQQHWYFTNPTPALNEPIRETDTNKIKIGDGITPYASLPYFGVGITATGTAAQYITGAGTYVTFPTDLSSFTNGPGYLTSASLTGYAQIASPPLTLGSVLFADGSGKIAENNAIFFWDNVNSTFYVGGNSGAFPMTTAHFVANTNNFSQINYINLSNGTVASTDFVATADTGTQTTKYVNLGINSSGYADPTFTITGALGSYLYSNGGNLSIGTSTTNNVVFFTGGTLAANEVVNINASPGGLTAIFNLKGSVTASSGGAKGGYVSTTLTAIANNDILVGFDVGPTYVPGAFTGVTSVGLRSIGADILVNNVMVGSGGISSVTVVGNNSLKSNTGASNTAMGNLALRDNTSGAFNTSFGASSLSQITTTSSHTAFGRGAGFSLVGTTGSTSTFIGFNSGNNISQTATPINQTILGNAAFGTADNQIVIGNGSVTQMIIGQTKLTFTLPASGSTVVFASGGTWTQAGAFGATNTYTATTNATFPAGTGTLAYLAVANIWAPIARATGVAAAYTLTGPADTNYTLSTAAPKVLFTLGSTQWATGALAATQGFFTITQPTISFVGASTATLVASVRIQGAPIQGSLATNTTSVGLLVDAVTSIAGAGTSYGAFFNAQTGGTTNFALGLAGNLNLSVVGNGILIKEGTNGRMGQVNLVAGTKAISISGVTTSTRAFVTLVTPSGTSLTTTYQAVCTSGTLTLQANIAAGTINASDVSTLNYILFDPAP